MEKAALGLTSYEGQMRKLYGAASINPFYSISGLNEAIRRLLDPFSSASRSWDGSISALKGSYTDTWSAIAAAAKSPYDDLFRLPKDSEILNIARGAFDSSELTRRAFGSVDQLKIAMQGVHEPWLRIGSLSASGSALSEILAIGRRVETLNPFDIGLVGDLRSGLGDEHQLQTLATTS